MKRILLIVGDDHWGHVAAATHIDNPRVLVARNIGASPSRALRLVMRGSIPPWALVSMAWAELRRPKVTIPIKDIVSSNADVLDLADRANADTVVLFRAGVIISSKVLGTLDVLNVHCASLDGYGGLASIYRALRDRAFRQSATLHRVTTRIDDGEVLDLEPYTLPGKSYRDSEDIAYAAGIRILDRTINRLVADTRSGSVI